MILQGALVAGMVLCLGAAEVEAQDELSIEMVKDGLYVIFGPGGNVGVRVTDEGVILVDDKFPQNFDAIHRDDSLVKSTNGLLLVCNRASIVRGKPKCFQIALFVLKLGFTIRSNLCIHTGRR